MSVMGLLGGALKGLGAGMQADIEYQREMALEEIRAQRRQAERQQDRGWQVEDRDAGFAHEETKWDAQDAREEARLEAQDAREAMRQDRQDARAAARDAALAARIDGRGNEPPSSIRESETVARWEEEAAAGDEGSKRKLAAYNRFQTGKSDPEARARDYAKMIQEENKSLLEGGEMAPDGKSWSEKSYDDRRAEAKRRVDDIIGMGRELSGSDAGKTRMERPAPAAPPKAPNAEQERKPPAGYPDARYSERAGGWVTQRDGKWFLIGQ